MRVLPAIPVVSLLTILLLAQLPQSANTTDAVSHRVLQRKSFYFGNIFKLNWHKADAFCRSIGQFLVSINSQAQLDEVIGYVKRSGFFRTERNLQIWTSGNDLGERNHYIWTVTGERFLFDGWSAGEPNHKKVDDCRVERCVAFQHYDIPYMISYSLDDRDCETEYYFLCESLDG